MTSSRTIPTSSMSEPEKTSGALMPAAVGREGTPPSDTRQPVTLIDLALAFLKIAMVSLGGGLSAWALRVLVEERRWLTQEEFLGALTLCRILPGANQVNLAVHVGTRYRGVAGATAALAGLTVVPLLIVLVLGGLYFRHQQVPALKDSMSGLVAAAAGMTLAVAVKLDRPVPTRSGRPRAGGGGLHRHGRVALAAPGGPGCARPDWARLVLASPRAGAGGTGSA